MREPKKHWMAGKARVFGLPYSLCGRVLPAFANAKKNVTCKNCARILAGYKGSK